MASIRIWFENLAVPNAYSVRLPLSALAMDDEHTHVHGGLRLEIGGRLVPHLGFFGPDDVCFNEWLDALWSADRALESSSEARYVFEDCEQGQPSFLFERVGDRAYFSIIEGVGGGESDPDWQRVEFDPEEFLSEHARFRESFLAKVRSEAPDAAEEWLRQFNPPPGNG